MTPTTSEKYCPACDHTYEDARAAFSLNGTHADGSPRFRPKCKACVAKYSKAWRDEQKGGATQKPVKKGKPSKAKTGKVHPVARLVTVNTNRCTIVVYRHDGGTDRLPYSEEIARQYETDGATVGWLPICEVAS